MVICPVGEWLQAGGAGCGMTGGVLGKDTYCCGVWAGVLFLCPDKINNTKQKRMKNVKNRT